MSILVDSRVGSNDLAPHLSALGLPVELLQLEYGDVAFSGNGPDGATLSIGIELKRMPDLLASFASGRLISHQVPGLLAAYDAVYLVVEGRTRANASGLLEWAKEVGGRSPKTICNWSEAGYGERRWTYREVQHRLHTLELKAGLHVQHTDSTDATVALIAALYAWWHSDEWDAHTSHIAQATKYVRPSMGGPVLLTPPTLRERVAAQFPGVGGKNAAMVAGKFESVREMVNADAASWMQLPGIGKKVASGIIAAITGKNAA